MRKLKTCVTEGVGEVQGEIRDQNFANEPKKIDDERQA